ncbi:hypothetical protein VTI74DRAFT_1050 [Chaetomium olivicolor]
MARGILFCLERRKRGLDVNRAVRHAYPDASCLTTPLTIRKPGLPGMLERRNLTPSWLAERQTSTFRNEACPLGSARRRQPWRGTGLGCPLLPNSDADDPKPRVQQVMGLLRLNLPAQHLKPLRMSLDAPHVHPHRPLCEIDCPYRGCSIDIRTLPLPCPTIPLTTGSTRRTAQAGPRRASSQASSGFGRGRAAPASARRVPRPPARD